MREDGPRAVAEVIAVSEAGRAPKNDPAIFALAYAVAEGNGETKHAALDALPRVCRTGTHLFQFCSFLDASFGKLTGRAKRRALARWYTEKTTDSLAYQLVKYRQRHGWTHRDVLRLCHPASKVSAGNPRTNASDEHARLFAWTVGKPIEGALPAIIRGFVEIQEKPAAAARIIREYRLPREAVPAECLTDPGVWRALLDVGMPLTAMVRNLGNMTRLGVLATGTEETAKVAATITDRDLLRKARVHPLAVLLALATYRTGRGLRGSGEWAPVPAILDALDEAFYLAFGAVEPTGKRILQAIDVSGSMDGYHVAGTPLSAREAAAALAMVAVASEPLVETVTFSNGAGAFMSGSRGRFHFNGIVDGLQPFALSRRRRLDDVVYETACLQMGGTDCALPMLYATAVGKEFDAFVVYTDSETWAGGVHPAQALAEYRRKSGIAAKLVVVAMTSNGFSIADPNDAGMLDVVGMDAATPAIISDFAAGRI